VARDRKRAKQRRERRGGALAGRNRPEAGAAPTEQPLHRADVPGALDHASGEVEEFDAALVRGADGVEADSDALEADADALDPADELDAADDALQAPEAGSGRGADGGGLRASWAELQRVQWPDRRQVTQATAVVLGFVAIAGAYLGAADFVAKEVVEFILG
jgi:preprotein translocase subunit SecE